MLVRVFRATIVLSCLLCLLNSQSTHAKRMYRLIDQYGNTLFSDQVPPEQSQNRRDLLSPSARILETTEKAKTKEQLDLENRLAELRQEEEKLIARQKLHDNALLKTYSTKEDLYTALKAKMQLYDDQRKIIQGHLKDANNELENDQKAAARYERSGLKLPQKLIDDMKASQIKIQNLHAAARANDDKQHHVKNEFLADIERYLFLTQSIKKPSEQTNIPSIKQANALGLFHCDNDHQCNKAWEIARDFVNRHSTTIPDVYNDKLIMNRPPATDTDISLSLSRIAISDDDYELFLDIHCHNSSIGEELCSSQRVKDLRSSFRAYVNDTLSRSAQ